jgi:predicted transcriptional regulator
MDMALTTGEVAESLGTTRSRIHRAVTAGVVRPTSTRGGHLRFTPGDVAVLERRLGKIPRLDGLSREAGLVLAALARRPLGLRSARAVARAAGVSPTAASRALKLLQREGLVERQKRRVVLGRVVDVEVWRVNVAHRRWQQLGPVLDSVVLPDRWVHEMSDRKVPGWLRHLFWNVDVDRLDVNRDGAFIAGRVLASEDAQAHAWAATTLASDAFLAAASQRGLDPRRVALARNLAARSGS